MWPPLLVTHRAQGAGEEKGRHSSVKRKDEKVLAHLGSLTTCTITTRGLKNT